jgi:hypothetical protein
MAANQNDCGALLRASLGSWVVAMLCGDQKFLVGGSTLQQAEEAARDREWHLRTHYKPNRPNAELL